MTNFTLSSVIAELSKSENLFVISGITRGIEREALRIDGKRLSQKEHPKEVGSALTNPYITTDFSESLLEFITPAQEDAAKTLNQLSDIQKFTLSHMGSEVLWPVSMPCYIKSQQEIKLAYYGESNTGRMKTLYREGLKNRYGSMMQAIAGVHFNLSFNDELWPKLALYKGENSVDLQDFKSRSYLGLIRNFKREFWLLSYLFGASPALCQSFLEDKSTPFEFKKLGKGTLYLEHATSLRMGDLGYTNSAQSSLRVTYNSLEEYIAGLTQAISTPSSIFQPLGDYTSESPKQLNANILQIENEFYSPIRPKRNAARGQTPTEALQDGGIEYIEVRALDVNPFSQTGISEQQINFLDVFLLYCLLKPSPRLSWQAQRETQANLDKVVTNGRDPELMLNQFGQNISLRAWGKEIFVQLADVAQLLDKAYNTSKYSATVNMLSSWLENSELTISGRYLGELIASELDNGEYALQLANRYKETMLNGNYKVFDEEHMSGVALSSLNSQKDIEQQDEVDFTRFLRSYFGK